MTRKEIALIVAGFVCSVVLSYVAATMGQPNALWMWRDILGVDVGR